jgi:hypothetical protein
MNDTNDTSNKWYNRNLAPTRLNYYLMLGVLNVMVMLGLWIILLEIVPSINSQVAKGYSLEMVTGMAVVVNWVLAVAGLLAINGIARLLVRFKIV